MVPRLLKRALLLGVLLGLAPLAGFAQGPEGVWESVGGPVAFVSHLAAAPDSPDFLFAFLTQGVYRNNDRTQASQGYLQQSWAPYFSADGGDTWQPASNDLAQVEPTMLEITAGAETNKIWVGTAADGLWRSDNGGRSWRPVVVTGLENQRVAALATGARGQLYLLTLDNTRYPASHLYTSLDGGFNWEQRLLQSYTGNPATQALDLVADPFESGRLYAVTYGGLLLSEDGGFSWAAARLSLPEGAFPGGETVLAADPTQRSRLFLVNRSTNLDGSDQLAAYRSIDGGETWEMLPAQFDLPAGAGSPRPQRLRLDPINRRQFFLATNHGLLASSDAGLSWTSAGAALEGASVVDVFLHPRRRGRWIAIGGGGIWRTANAGGQWRALGEGLPTASSIHSLVALPADATLLLALNGGPIPLESANQPLWRSVDGGKSWLPAMRGLEGVLVRQLYVNPADPEAVYALSATGFARSDDRGSDWHHVGLPATPLHLAFGAEPDQLYIASLDGLWRSNDRGASWRQASLGNGPVPAVASDRRGRLYAVASDAAGRRMWRSDDGGDSWTPLAEMPEGEIAGLQAHPAINDFLILRLTWGGLYLSVDGARTWVRSDEGIPAGVRWRGPLAGEPAGPNLLALHIAAGGDGYWWVSRDGGGIYRSLDNGRTWSNASADLGDNLIFAFAAAGERLLAGTGSLGLIERVDSAGVEDIPRAVDVRIEIVWPHAYAPVAEAERANLGLRLYESRSLQPPPCAWTPNVEVWMARDAGPLRRVDLATQRTVEGRPFPFWELNDIDVTWARDPDHKLIFLARVAPTQAESYASAWIHAADARTYLPQPPMPAGLTVEAPAAIDALIRVVWPHNAQGEYVPAQEANLVNISAVLFTRNSNLALAPDHLPERVWLVGALDNQVGRRLLAGAPQPAEGEGFGFTTFEFNNVDVSLARNPEHHWTFWLDVPDLDTASNVWVHGIDARTHAPNLLEPISGCQP